MKKRFANLLAAFAFAALGLAGCAAEDPTSSHINALTGAVCTPNAAYTPRAAHANGQGGGNQCQGTSNGDNCDDLHSGKIDCIGDGNSGQGDDKKHNCEFPQPGCDDEGCCDGEIVDPPPTDPPPPPPPPTDEPPVEDPPPPPPPEPVIP